METKSKTFENLATSGALEPKVEVFEEEVENINTKPVQNVKKSLDCKFAENSKNAEKPIAAIEPKQEVLEEGEIVEPVTKKAKIPEISKPPVKTIPTETKFQEKLVPIKNPKLSLSPDSGFSVFKSILTENRQLKEEVTGYRTDVKNLHQAVLEISNTAVNDRIQLQDRIRILEAELREKIQKTDEIVRENSKFTARYILDQKNLMDSITGSLEQKQEQSVAELREKVEKFQNAELTVLKLLEEKVEAVEKHQGDSSLEKRISSLEFAMKAKIKSYSKVIQDCRDCMKEMKNASKKPEEVPVPVDEKPIVRSDDCVLSPSRAELDYQAKCIFCKSKSHLSIACRTVPDYAQRIRVLQKQHRCIMCLDMCDPDEHHQCPREKVMCSNCEWNPEFAKKDKDFHHVIVCKHKDQSKECKKRNREENERRIRHGALPRFVA